MNIDPEPSEGTGCNCAEYPEASESPRSCHCNPAKRGNPVQISAQDIFHIIQLKVITRKQNQLPQKDKNEWIPPLCLGGLRGHFCQSVRHPV